jgi:CBS domain-containing protein
VVQDGILLGMAQLKNLNGAASEVATTIAPEPAQYPYIYPDQSLSLALEKMGAAGVDALPVVSRANFRQMLGVLTLPDILHAYGLMETES